MDKTDLYRMSENPIELGHTLEEFEEINIAVYNAKDQRDARDKAWKFLKAVAEKIHERED